MHTEQESTLYPVPQPIRKAEWARIRRKLFTQRQCDDLVRFAETNGRYYRSGGKRINRNVEICYLLPQEAPWAYEKIAAAFASENIWGLVLSSIVEPMRIQRYRQGGFTRPHSDYDYRSSDHSKITAIVPLVGRTSWEGGDFLLQGTPIRRVPDKGDCLLFPSFAWHSLSPVTKGTRIVLSAWVAGPRLI
jgi:predicted 2-oxoglutarate/Fe(II)-dependent dioxygenase YbiX